MKTARGVEVQTSPSHRPPTESAKGSQSYWQAAWLQARLVGRLLRDRQVPFYLKLIPAATLGYLLVPLDLLPDAFLGLGQVDDIGILLLGAKVFIELAPADIVARHRRDLQGEPGGKETGKDELIESIIIDHE